ncbi:MAG TPA: hypothetical protein VFJ86_04595, partial [Usitatibacter sp.]|nr:hypothetical protein [Usitatibacter sp.]
MSAVLQCERDRVDARTHFERLHAETDAGARHDPVEAAARLGALCSALHAASIAARRRLAA